LARRLPALRTRRQGCAINPKKYAPVTTAGPVARTLDVEDLTVRYGQALAVDGVTLAIEPGEVVALLGPSGCGKTTLLRVIAGFIRQSAGRVMVDGATIDHLPANQRNIGIVFRTTPSSRI